MAAVVLAVVSRAVDLDQRECPGAAAKQWCRCRRPKLGLHCANIPV